MKASTNDTDLDENEWSRYESLLLLLTDIKSISWRFMEFIITFHSSHKKKMPELLYDMFLSHNTSSMSSYSHEEAAAAAGVQQASNCMVTDLHHHHGGAGFHQAGGIDASTSSRGNFNQLAMHFQEQHHSMMVPDERPYDMTDV